MKGVDFELNTRCPDVDFMTIHVYPDNWYIRSSFHASPYYSAVARLRFDTCMHDEGLKLKQTFTLTRGPMVLKTIIHTRTLACM